ncbi:MAG: BCCT family transporter [Bacillota bacterium]|nr:BCCT family transporter [Bacillota bacterium]
MSKKISSIIDPPVFYISAVIALAFILWGWVASESMSNAVNAINGFLLSNFGWSYLLGATFFLVFVIVIAFSKYGDIKLGKDDDKPEFSTTTWFAMLFSAGMGIGLVFWSIAEPMWHYVDPPMGFEGGAIDTVMIASRTTFFHWGLHPWAIFVVVGLALAYFQFRKGLPALVSSTLYPILGEEGLKGPIAKSVDILAVFATLFGVATSLGLGASQITQGLSHVYGISDGIATTLVVIAIITVLFTISTVTGIHRGIKYLSNINITLAILFILFFTILGPTRFIFNFFTESIGVYFQNIIHMSFWADTVNQTGWLGWWTVFYWAWWIAWAPFVGGFIARISKGRTIREFLLGVLFAPVLMSFFWLSAFGGAAFWVELFGAGGIADSATANAATALFVTLSHYPIPAIMSTLATIMIATFFITSADSATYVLGMLTSKGDLEPIVPLRIFWGTVNGAIAAVLLYIGGLGALQTASIASAFPFMIVMFAMSYALVKALRQEFAGNVYVGEVKAGNVSGNTNATTLSK